MVSKDHKYTTECGVRRPDEPLPGTSVGPMGLPASYRRAPTLRPAKSPGARNSSRGLRGLARQTKK